MRYHAVMIDETGCEFGVGVEAASRSEAQDQLREDYPESRCDQLEDPRDTHRRESALDDLIRRGADFDEEGRPFFPNGDSDEWDEDDEDPSPEDDWPDEA